MILLITILMLIGFLLTGIYPARFESEKLWIMYAAVALCLCCEGMTGRMRRLSAESGGPMSDRAWVLTILLQAAFTGAMAVVLITQLGWNDGWPPAAGFALMAAACTVTLGRGDIPGGDAEGTEEEVRGIHAVKAYHAMEKYVEQGKIRSLGLSNWYVEELKTFLPQVNITPALVQNEIHPYYQEQDVVPFIQENGIVVQCWYPLGGRGYTAELLGDPVISAIADAHGVSSAQVILRWDLQRGIVVIPGSGNPEHIKENLDLFGFELTETEMSAIAALDRGEKHDWY